MPLRTLLPLILLFCSPVMAQAFKPAVDPFVSSESSEQQRISPLDTGDENKLALQRQRIVDLASEIGRHLNNDRDNDLAVLQLLLDQRLVTASDSYLLQAMGVVLGDIYAREFQLSWVIYRDKAGKSRALQLGNSNEVLFPVTMISRRAETGMHVDVRAVYEQGAEVIRESRSSAY
ncbi:MAG TPA: DUF3806 domain-containing protein [Pseudomonadales bacterium]